MFSSGAGSWAAAKRVAEQHGTEGLVLLFADTLIEDEDNYRFLDEAAANIGVQPTTVAEGRDPWQVFFDVRFLGNTRIDPCSRVLKRELLRPPAMSKDEALAWLRAEGIEPPRLYAAGFPHANCGGFCVKGGQAQFATLLRWNPERYAYHERREQELREYLGADVAILRDRTGGETRPLTLRAFRERLEAQPSLFDADEWGACACFTPSEAAA
jgi:hypothetical protein